MEEDKMRRKRDIEELKEKLKKGTISYFSITEDEAKELETLLKQEINQDTKEIGEIREKIKKEKKKLKSNL